MDPRDLTPERREALHALARRRAHELRDQAIADAFGALAAWLRRRFALAPTPRTPNGAACRS